AAPRRAPGRAGRRPARGHADLDLRRRLTTRSSLGARSPGAARLEPRGTPCDPRRFAAPASPARPPKRFPPRGGGPRPAPARQNSSLARGPGPAPSRLTRDRAYREKRYASVPTSCLFPVQGPDEPEALEGEPGVDTLDRARVRGDQLGEAA